MKLNIQIDAGAVTKALASMRRQIPFAMQTALNTTAYDAQKAVQATLPQSFTFRSASSKRLFERAIKVDRSEKRALKYAIYVGGPKTVSGTDQRVAQMLTRHEDGGTHTSNATYRAGTRMFVGGFFLPAEGLRSKGANVPRYLYPRAIGAAERKDVSGATVFAKSVKGKGKRFAQRTAFFTIPGVGIFRREGRGEHSEVDAVWFFNRRIRLRPRLGFRATVERTVTERWTENAARAVAKAIETAR